MISVRLGVLTVRCRLIVPGTAWWELITSTIVRRRRHVRGWWLSIGHDWRWLLRRGWNGWHRHWRRRIGRRRGHRRCLGWDRRRLN
jgi:hypothetical protein